MKSTHCLLGLLAVLLLASAPIGFAQTIDLDSGSYTLDNTDKTTPLLIGDVVQFGYFTQATSSHPFAGTFVPLTSAGATAPLTVIGQETLEGAGPGTFAYSDLNLSMDPNALPSNGQIMAFMIYNSATTTTATAFGAFADTMTPWSYSASDMFPIPQAFSLDDTGTWENNVVGYTGISLAGGTAAVPEPSTSTMFVAGIMALAVWRWRNRWLPLGLASSSATRFSR
jgi:hypothetical protein